MHRDERHSPAVPPYLAPAQAPSLVCRVPLRSALSPLAAGTFTLLRGPVLWSRRGGYPSPSTQQSGMAVRCLYVRTIISQRRPACKVRRSAVHGCVKVHFRPHPQPLPLAKGSSKRKEGYPGDTPGTPSGGPAPCNPREVEI